MYQALEAAVAAIKSNHTQWLHDKEKKSFQDLDKLSSDIKNTILESFDKCQSQFNLIQQEQLTTEDPIMASKDIHHKHSHFLSKIRHGASISIQKLYETSFESYLSFLKEKKNRSIKAIQDAKVIQGTIDTLKEQDKKLLSSEKSPSLPPPPVIAIVTPPSLPSPDVHKPPTTLDPPPVPMPTTTHRTEFKESFWHDNSSPQPLPLPPPPPPRPRARQPPPPPPPPRKRFSNSSKLSRMRQPETIPQLFLPIPTIEPPRSSRSLPNKPPPSPPPSVQTAIETLRPIHEEHTSTTTTTTSASLSLPLLLPIPDSPILPPFPHIRTASSSTTNNLEQSYRPQTISLDHHGDSDPPSSTGTESDYSGGDSSPEWKPVDFFFFIQFFGPG